MPIPLAQSHDPDLSRSSSSLHSYQAASVLARPDFCRREHGNSQIRTRAFALTGQIRQEIDMELREYVNGV